ncbi:MAG: hypothetical protein EBT09_13420, partial [Actinobacteria bacterium]|nr:hypothetical protein [Actinomycetota bacterium]
ATSLNAVITFPSADFVLVTSATDAAPVSATTGVGAVINSTGFAFGTGALASAPGAANTFRVASSLPTITLKIDGAALALAANDVKTVGRFYVRPKYNGDTSSATKNLTIAANPSLGIRASDGSLGFTTTVTGAGDFRVAVAKTTVTLSLKVADPADSTRKHRTGDTIQVELQVAASDIARNATSLDATITVPSADYVLVNAPTPSKVVATAPVVKTTNGVAFGNAFTSKGGSSADGTNNNLSGNTITLKIDGTALNLLSTTPVTIGTFYVRPKYNGDTSGAPKNLTIGASPMIGIRASDTNAGYTVGDLGFTFEAGVNGDINHVQTAIAINGSQFQIVEHGLLANSQTVTASAFGTNPVKSNTFASNVLTYEVASGDLSTLTAGTSPITIGTFYVRPRMKVVTNLDFTSTTVAN